MQLSVSSRKRPASKPPRCSTRRLCKFVTLVCLTVQSLFGHMCKLTPLTTGMTTANMKLVAVDVPFPDKLEKSAQKLEPGEYITARIVELAKLSEELRGTSDLLLENFGTCVTGHFVEYEKKVGMQFKGLKVRYSLPSQGFVVDARLSHLAIGIEMAEKLRQSKL